MFRGSGLAPKRCSRAGRAAPRPLDDTQVTRRGAPGGNEKGDHSLFHRGDRSVFVKGSLRDGLGFTALPFRGNRLPRFSFKYTQTPPFRTQNSKIFPWRVTYFSVP